MTLQPDRILEATTISGSPVVNPPPPPSSDPTQPWSAGVCQNRTATDSSNLTSSTPTIEWCPVLNSADEMDSEVGMSGAVAQVMMDDADNDFSRDFPLTHPFYNDYRCQIVVDDPYTSLLAPGNKNTSDGDWIAANAAAQSLGMTSDRIASGGFIELEIDRGLLPDIYRPQEGDRVAVWGRWIVDCGHTIFSTEIHPPLLVAAARAVSGDSTTVTVLGRAFMVSQYYDGKAIQPYLLDQMAEVSAEVIASGGLAIPFLSVAARPKIMSPPFENIQTMAFTVRPPRPRANPTERLLLSYHFVTRSGVSVDVAAGGQAADEVLVVVTMNDVTYQSAAEPPSHDVTVPLSTFGGDAVAFIEAIVSLNPAAAPVINKGIVTSRYDMPPAASSQDGVNVVNDIEIGSVPISLPAQPTDDSQPYPIYGWLKLQFQSSNAMTTDTAPGAAASGNTCADVAKSPDGRIFYNYWTLGGGGQGWVEVPGGGRTDAALAAALVGSNNDYLFVVVKGLDGNVYLNQGTLGGAFVGWQQMGFQTDAAAGAASSGNNSVIVAKSPDGRIFYNYWTLGGGGQGWVEVPGGGRTDAAPAAALVGSNNDYLFVVVKGLDGNVYLNQGTLGGAFVGWQQMGFQTDAAAGAASSGNNSVIVAKSTDGRIFYNYWTLGGGGQGWVEVPGGGRTDAAPAAALVGSNNDYLFVVVKGLDGNVYLNQGTLGGAFVGWQ